MGSVITETDPEKLREILVKSMVLRWTERMGQANTSVESIERLVDELLVTLDELGYVVGEPVEDA